MKQGTFSQLDKLKAMAIVNIFETSKQFGEYSALAVLNDGAGISYGINQFTHRSGSLLAVVNEYLDRGGAVGRTVIEDALPKLRRTDPTIIRSLASDEKLKKALRAAAITTEMREAQQEVAFEKYLRPAIEACEGSGFVLPLSLAVIYDSITHGSYERLRDQVDSKLQEKAWITSYVRIRDRWLASVPRLNSTRYRTRFFLNQIAVGKWDLDLPLNVHGYKLTHKDLQDLPVTAGSTAVVGPNIETSTNLTNENKTSNDPQIHTSTPQAQPPISVPRVSSPTVRKGALADARASDTLIRSETTEDTERSRPLDEIENCVDSAAAKYDQVERVTRTITTRTDAAKSLWTTVVGTVWQTAWALIGFLAGLPREVWLVVAIIAALLMLFYLYRQITLGKVRERGLSCPHTPQA